MSMCRLQTQTIIASIRCTVANQQLEELNGGNITGALKKAGTSLGSLDLHMNFEYFVAGYPSCIIAPDVLLREYYQNLQNIPWKCYKT